MTNEIKEILDDLDYCKNMKAGNILLKYNECDLLLDYITNLQEEICFRGNFLEDLLNRIDKAIDYINEIDEPELRVIKEILKGEE